MIAPKAVARARKEAGFTQQGLAKKACVSQSSIAKLERGLLRPSYEIMFKIDAVLAGEHSRNGLCAQDFVKNCPVSCAPSDRLDEVTVSMNRRNYSQMPVFERGHVVGLITERDIMRGLVQQQVCVADVMSPPPPIIPAEASEDLVYALLDHVDLIIVNENGKQEGIITKNDIFRVLRQKNNVKLR